MQNRQGKRNLYKPIDDLANNISRCVAVKKTVEHLYLKVGTQAGLVQANLHIAQNVAGVSWQVGEFTLQVEMLDDAHDGLVQVVGAGIPRLVGRQRIRVVTFNVLGADSWPHKNKFILKITAVQNFGGH